jgi:hypothetical protein
LRPRVREPPRQKAHEPQRTPKQSSSGRCKESGHTGNIVPRQKPWASPTREGSRLMWIRADGAKPASD